MKRSHLAVLAGAIALGAVGAPRGAHAQAPASAADRLFRQGVALFERGQLKAACDKFSASYAIDPAAGTLFNLASCHERIAQWADARREFLDLAARATATGANDKAQQARDRAHAAELHLPRLALNGAREHGFAVVTVDGAVVPPAEWTSPVIVTAGQHVVEANAAGKPSARVIVTARAETETPVDLDTASVEAPVLVPLPGSPTEASSAPLPPADVVESGAKTSSPWRTVGWVTGAAGVVLIGGGAYFGVKTFTDKSDADSSCGAMGGTVCSTVDKTKAAQDSLDSAHHAATFADVGLIAGAVALGVGAYLVLRPSPSSAAAASLHLAPLVGAQGGGATLGGAF